MNFDLILKVVLNITHKKFIAGVNKLLVIWVINLWFVSSVFDKEKGKVLDCKTAKQSLVFVVWFLLIIYLEQNEFF